MQDKIYLTEIDVDKLLPSLSSFVNYYSVISKFPPIIEDVNIILTGNYDDLISKIKKTSNLIKNIELVDKYENKLTLRITYHSDDRQLASSDLIGVRNQIEGISQS